MANDTAASDLPFGLTRSYDASLYPSDVSQDLAEHYNVSQQMAENLGGAGSWGAVPSALAGVAHEALNFVPSLWGAGSPGGFSLDDLAANYGGYIGATPEQAGAAGLFEHAEPTDYAGLGQGTFGATWDKIRALHGIMGQEGSESFVMPESGLDAQGRTISPVSTAPGYGVPGGYEVIGTSPEEQLAFVIDPSQDALTGQTELAALAAGMAGGGQLPHLPFDWGREWKATQALDRIKSLGKGLGNIKIPTPQTNIKPTLGLPGPIKAVPGFLGGATAAALALKPSELDVDQSSALTKDMVISTPGWKPGDPIFREDGTVKAGDTTFADQVAAERYGVQRYTADPAKEAAATMGYLKPGEFGLDPFTNEQIREARATFQTLMEETPEEVSQYISPTADPYIYQDQVAEALQKAQAEQTLFTGEEVDVASRAPVNLAEILRSVEPPPTWFPPTTSSGSAMVTEPIPTVEPSPFIGDEGFTPSLGGNTLGGPVVGSPDLPSGDEEEEVREERVKVIEKKPKPAKTQSQTTAARRKRTSTKAKVNKVAKETKVPKSAASEALSRARGDANKAIMIAPVIHHFTEKKKKDPAVYVPSIRIGPTGQWIGGL